MHVCMYVCCVWMAVAHPSQFQNDRNLLLQRAQNDYSMTPTSQVNHYMFTYLYVHGCNVDGVWEGVDRGVTANASISQRIAKSAIQHAPLGYADVLSVCRMPCACWSFFQVVLHIWHDSSGGAHLGVFLCPQAPRGGSGGVFLCPRCHVVQHVSGMRQGSIFFSFFLSSPLSFFCSRFLAHVRRFHN